MERLWSLAGAISGNRWQMAGPRKRRNQAKTGATGCDQLPTGSHGKEGVDRARPFEPRTKVLFEMKAEGRAPTGLREYLRERPAIRVFYLLKTADLQGALTPKQADDATRTHGLLHGN